MSRLAAIGDGGGSLVDRDHPGHWRGTTMQRITPPPPVPTAQMEHAPGQRTAQSAQVGPVDGLVDRLRAQPTLRLARELLAQPAGDLFRTPPSRQLALDPGP